MDQEALRYGLAKMEANQGDDAFSAANPGKNLPEIRQKSSSDGQRSSQKGGGPPRPDLGFKTTLRIEE